MVEAGGSLGFPIGPAEGALGAGLAEDLVLFGGEPRAPFRLGEANFAVGSGGEEFGRGRVRGCGVGRFFGGGGSRGAGWEIVGVGVATGVQGDGKQEAKEGGQARGHKMKSGDG